MSEKPDCLPIRDGFISNIRSLRCNARNDGKKTGGSQLPLSYERYQQGRATNFIILVHCATFSGEPKRAMSDK